MGVYHMAQAQELSVSCFNVMSSAAFVILLVTPYIGHFGGHENRVFLWKITFTMCVKYPYFLSNLLWELQFY